MIRQPAVAGSFYPGGKDALTKELETFMVAPAEKRRVTGLISPHAGYIYSGRCAGMGFSRVEIPASVLILGVNHRGYGHSFAVDGSDDWNTPLGNVALDASLRDALVQDSAIFAVDTEAGKYEHSLEVQVPFIQYLAPQTKILPVTVSSMDLRDLTLAGKEIGKLLEKNPQVLMVASTDMSHFLDASSAEIQDHKAIDKILAMDPKGLYETVREENITMCGVSPTVIMLTAALERGATTAETVHYTHSGESSGDYDRVVGYYSALVY